MPSFPKHIILKPQIHKENPPTHKMFGFITSLFGPRPRQREDIGSPTPARPASPGAWCHFTSPEAEYVIFQNSTANSLLHTHPDANVPFPGRSELCTICHKNLRNQRRRHSTTLVWSPCGHNFCSPCINSHLSRHAALSHHAASSTAAALLHQEKKGAGIGRWKFSVKCPECNFNWNILWTPDLGQPDPILGSHEWWARRGVLRVDHPVRNRENMNSPFWESFNPSWEASAFRVKTDEENGQFFDVRNEYASIGGRVHYWPSGK